MTSPQLRIAAGALDRRFHCASVDKVLIATLVGRMIDAGYLTITSPLGTLLPAADLAGLPAASDVDPAADITVEHLLTHTSGLPDYFDPPKGQDSPCSMQRAIAEPDRLWKRHELFDAVRSMRAVGRPGERFHYSDTGYLLLGRVAEEAGGLPYGQLLAREVLAPSGMEQTSVPFDDSLTTERLADLDLAPLWIGGKEMSRAAALSVGAGSIVTVADDLVRFQGALHAGRLITPALLNTLARPRHRLRRGIHYGAGLATLRFGELAPPLMRSLPQPVGGLGVTGTHMFFYPRQQAHVVLNMHSTAAMGSSFSTHVRIAQLLARQPG